MILVISLVDTVQCRGRAHPYLVVHGQVTKLSDVWCFPESIFLGVAKDIDSVLISANLGVDYFLK